MIRADEHVMKNQQKFNDRLLTHANPNAPNLKTVFALTYLGLLSSVAANHTEVLDRECESNLYWEFYAGLKQLNKNFEQI